MPQRLLYAITGHGYGHATRSLAIAREIERRFPDARITCSTSVPRAFLERSGMDLARGEHRLRDYEPGTVEGTCFEVDRAATCAAYRRFAAERERRIEAEALHLHQGGYAGVVSDIAAVPIAAAARAGIPAVAVSNFTWDWILAPLLAGADDLAGLPELLGGDYRAAEVYLRLPFHPEEHPFRAVEDLPLLGRRAALDRAEVRRRLGLPVEGSRPVVLVTIGGFGASGWPAVEVRGLGDLEFVVTGRLPIEFPGSGALRIEGDLPAGLGFADLVGAADLVLAKPGYGICSECAANGTRLVGVERRGFREYPCLREGVGRMVPYREISIEGFLQGRWEEPVRKALAAGPATPAPCAGAAEAARRIGAVLGLGESVLA